MSATASRARVPYSSAEPLALSGQPAGPAAAADTSDAARCTAGRGRLPGLRTKNGLGSTGATTAHGQGAALPLLLASSRGGCEAQGAGSGAALGPSLGQAARPVPAPLPRGLSADEPTARKSPPPAPARSPGAFLPPPAVQPVTLQQPDSTRQHHSAEGPPAAATAAAASVAGTVSSGDGDGACVGEAAAARAALAPVSDRRQSADGGSAGGGGKFATGSDAPAEGDDAVVVVQCQRQRQGTNNVVGDGEASSCSQGDGGSGAGRGSDDGDDDDTSSYGSCRSGSTFSGSDGRSLGGAMDAADGTANAEADGESEGARKRRRVGGTTPSAGASAAAAAEGQGGDAESPAAANGKRAAVEPEGADAAAAAADAVAAADGGGTTTATGRRRRRRSCYSYGPPWPLVPRSGRPGTLRFNIRAARALWPDLLAAGADMEDGQIVKLYVEVPAAAAGGSAAAAGSAADVADADADAATVVPVRAQLRYYDDAGMILRVVDAWPMGRGISPDKLLQISPHPAGDGALVQVANRHVWACYTVRGGKMCSPEVPPVQPSAGGTGSGGDGGGSGDAGGGGPPPDFCDGGALLQMRLGAGLFDNRSFDVGVRAAERLFGHLLERPRQQALGGGGGGEVGRAAEGGGTEAAKAGAMGDGPRAGPAAKAGPGTSVSSLPIHSVDITVIVEAYPQTRFQVEFRYRFPRLYGFASNARHSYATLSSSLMAPLVLCGAKQGDVLEMWRRPGGVANEFLCRVVRSAAADSGGNVRRAVAAKRRGSRAAGGGARADRCAAAGATAAAAAGAAVAAAAAAAAPVTAAVGVGSGAVVETPPAVASAADRG
ncbi:hypothetical protein PLESTF_001095800 [Pleodorina starrii]|nr:hypothetical protein PLESTF_001095800 [Pleodorina starrii]